jgi:flavin-dependent dehydrogenase
MRHRRLVVIGASFAGLACARAAAARGIETTVLDSRPEAGRGVRTTGILVKEAADMLDVPQHLVRKLATVRLYAPSLRSIDLRRPGYSFLATDTPNLLRWWAREAERHGAEIRWRSRFRGAERGPDGALEIPGQGLRCGFLVGADGADSAVARYFRLSTNTRFLSGIEAECRGIAEIPDDRLHVFLDSELARGYIGWVVPGVGVTQVGLACRRPSRPDLPVFMRRLATLFDTSGLDVTGYRAGLIPVGGPLRRSSDRDVLLIGDAAGWVSPLTAGGIHCALQWGRTAGISITDHLLDGGPHPGRVLQRQLPSFRLKRGLRQLYDLGPPNRLYDLLLDRPLLRRFAQLVFFHHRGVLSRDAWAEWMELLRA